MFILQIFIIATIPSGIPAILSDDLAPETALQCMNMMQTQYIVSPSSSKARRLMEAGLPPLLQTVIVTGEEAGDFNPSTEIAWKSLIADGTGSLLVYTEMIYRMVPGEQQDDAGLDALLAKLKPNECCAVAFEHPPSEIPKAYLYSHDNLVWTAVVLRDSFSCSFGSTNIVDLRPLDNIETVICSVVLPVVCAGSAWFSLPDRSPVCSADSSDILN